MAPEVVRMSCLVFLTQKVVMCLWRKCTDETSFVHARVMVLLAPRSALVNQ